MEVNSTAHGKKRDFFAWKKKRDIFFGKLLRPLKIAKREKQMLKDFADKWPTCQRLSFVDYSKNIRNFFS